MMGSSGSTWRADVVSILYGGGAGNSLVCFILTDGLGGMVSTMGRYGKGNGGGRDDGRYGDAVTGTALWNVRGLGWDIDGLH
jgi:hypothetical protein